jgi:hypothetical protein
MKLHILLIGRQRVRTLSIELVADHAWWLGAAALVIAAIYLVRTWPA